MPEERYTLGRISYVNSLPFFQAEYPEFDSFSAVPAELNARAARAGVDAAMISRWVYEGEIEKYYKVLPRYGIFSDGEVMSVKIFSKVPFESFPDASLYITPESGTSARAFAHLFRLKYGADILSMPRAPLDSADAALLIGDAALAFKPREFCADLGEMWRAEIGIPMVYSVFVVRRSVFSKVAPLLEKNIKNSLDAFRKNPDSVIGAAVGAMRPSGADIDEPALKKYYRNLKYELPRGLFKKAFGYAAALARSEIPTK